MNAYTVWALFALNTLLSWAVLAGWIPYPAPFPVKVFLAVANLFIFGMTTTYVVDNVEWRQWRKANPPDEWERLLR